MNDQPPASRVKRRGFIGAGLLVAGAAIGALARRAEPIRPVKKTSPLDSRFAYDVTEFEKTDPLLLRYRPGDQFDTGFNRVARIAVSSDGIWVAGDKALKLFDSRGKLKRELKLDYTITCLRVEGDELFVGARDFYCVLDSDGKQRFKSAHLGEKTYLTALHVHRDAIYIADAGNREVLICGRKSGEIIERFGKQESTRDNPGFAIPSPYFALDIASDNRLRIANTGRLRIETYSLDGRFESAWGEAGMQIDRFCGCCNPVFFTITRGGNFITSEKGLARINIYSPTGTFIGAVAGPDTLIEDKDLARRACVDCRVGSGFDVAVDAQDNVFALDPFKKAIRCFIPLTDT